MSPFIDELPLPKTSSDLSAPVEDRLPRAEEGLQEGRARGESLPAAGASFLTILLRALSAWGV